jgi:NAD(P) transhydrogenase subunit alpha
VIRRGAGRPGIAAVVTTRSISAISIVGALVVAGSRYSLLASILGFVAVTCATINVVGGFIITDRMLRMFKREEKPAEGAPPAGGTSTGEASR